MIDLILYESKYQPAFKRLNMEWLDKHGLTESHDLEILDDPQGTVIDPGGIIFLAKENELIIGTAGLWKENDSEYELVKMAVDPLQRGRGIGKLLLNRCLQEARDRHATRVFLFSSSKLTTALKLYQQSGFNHVAVTDSPFVTADVKMEIFF